MHKISNLILLIALLLPLYTVSAQYTEFNKAWSEAWEFGNALTVMDYASYLYDSHASLLIESGDEIANGISPTTIIMRLEKQEGVNGVIITKASGKSVQSDGVDIDITAFNNIVLNKSQSTAKYQSPMMQKKVGGLTRFIPLRMDEDSLDIMVRYVHSDDGPPIAVVSLILDRSWLIDQIPSFMDSLSRESRQLLFWAESPTNKLVEQSLGILCKSDTLWWSGNKDVIVSNIQTMWPFADIEIHSFVRGMK